MAFDWLEALGQLGEIRIFDYFKKRSMPEFAEPLVTELVQWFSASSEEDRRRFLDAVPHTVSSVLGWYGRKLAGRAVRNCSRIDLWNGLIAIAISATEEDARDLHAPLSLLYNTALRLNEDPRLLFEAASRDSTQQAFDLFMRFVDKPADQKSIGAFGFSEGNGPLGFDYVPLLPEFGGPTPLQADNGLRLI